MRTQLTKITLAAGLMLAMAFTFTACSSDDDGGGGGGSFNENSQIFNEDGTKSTLSGTIIGKGLWWENGDDWSDTLINAGSVSNGVVNLQLPQTIPDKFLLDVDYIWEEDGCTISDHSAKISEPLRLDLYNGDENVGYLSAMYIDAKVYEYIFYIYSSKAVNINCNYKSDRETITANLKYIKGLNKSYGVESDNRRNGKFSTDNILTKEVKWMLLTKNNRPDRN
jgi:hypothetical protein